MSWVPLVTVVLQYIMMMLQAINHPEKVSMIIRTADGKVSITKCNVVKTGPHKAKITSTFESKGTPIIEAYIRIGNRAFAKAHLPEQKLFQAGPVEFGGEF